MQLKNGQYVSPNYANAINRLIWSSIEDPDRRASKKENFIALMDLVLGLGFMLDNGAADMAELDFDSEDKRSLDEISSALYKLKSKCDHYQP